MKIAFSVDFFKFKNLHENENLFMCIMDYQIQVATLQTLLE